MTTPDAGPALQPALSEPELLRQHAHIDGQWCDADSGETRGVLNPATGDTIATIPWMTGIETRRAIDAADTAFASWRNTSADHRATLLRRWGDLVLQHADDLAHLLTAEQGKPVREALGEIRYAADYIFWFAEEARRISGEVGESRTGPGSRAIILRQPVGVVAAITPWNFPAAMITRKLAPALAAGCCVVLKPALATPLTALALSDLASRAGLPDGAINVVTGSARAIGEALTSDHRVRKLSFTGSTEIGRKLLEDCAPTVKKVSMELGGNAPFIVFDDAEIDAAIDGIMTSKFRNAGQTCVCANRIYVHRPVYDEIAARLNEQVSALRVGAGNAADTEIGPLIDEAALEKVEAHIADALVQGAEIGCGGRRHSRGGLYFQPTLITCASQDMAVAREETFGPLAALIPFDDEAQVIEWANASEFGLAAYVYTRDIGRAWRVGEKLESGMVGINTGVISDAGAPFGGIKQSGLGREGSRHGLEDYQELKYLCLSGLA